MRRVVKNFVRFAVFGILLGTTFDVNGYLLKITCRAKGIELTLFKAAIDEWVKLTGNQHRVEVVTLPHSSNECFALYKQWLSAESFDIDILQMDFPWIGAFSNVLADLKQFYGNNKIDESDFFESIRKNMYSGDRLVALPAYTDCEIMYYRKDLLEKYSRSVPKTWKELYESAKLIQREERKTNQRFYGYVTQAKAFEMLTCNFVQMIDAFGGSVIKEGQVVVNSPECINALVCMMECLKDTSTGSVLNYSEEEARGLFQAGNALFMNSWPYAWSLMNAEGTGVSGKIGVMPIPAGDLKKGKTSGALGGWFFTVSKYSKHADVAADLVRFLTDKEQHKIRSRYAYAPAYKSLYQDAEVLEANPSFSVLHRSLENSVARPASTFGKDYPRASSEIFNIINIALTESLETDDIKNLSEKYLTRLAKKLKNILRRQKRQMEARSSKGIFQRLMDMLKLSQSQGQ